jgi:hypothetical protein
MEIRLNDNLFSQTRIFIICKNGQLVTKAKIKRTDSANLKCIATNKLYRRLTVTCSEMPASF